MSKKHTYILAVGLLIFWLLLTSVLRDNLSTDPEAPRWFNDHNDRWIYMEIGGWLPRHEIPYRDTPSEYPQVPTCLFGILRLFSPGTNEQTIYFLHSSLFTFLMLLFLFLTIRLLYTMLPRQKWMAYLMLLPGSLYFTYNRFDILPAFLALWSLWFLQRNKLIPAGIVLGIGTFTKWYPALLFPVFLSYRYTTNGKRVDWKLILSFLGTCVLIIAPTLLTGGWAALTMPYQLHASRGMEQVSLPVLLNLVLERGGYEVHPDIMIYIFLVLQVLLAAASLFARIASLDEVLQWTIMAIGTFVVFSRIYSPQWILWLVPFIVLATRNRFDATWIFLYNAAVYLSFPLAFELRGFHSLEYKLSGLITVMIPAAAVAIAFFRAEIHFSRDSIALSTLRFREKPPTKT